MKPNVILITVDQMRGDCLGVKGHPVVETPYLDMMAREGILFSHAYSAVPSCIPARAALFTGLSQRSHGRVGYKDGVPWNYECTLPGEFAKAGYHTQGIGKMHVYPERSLCGFHNIILHDGYVHFGRDMSKPASEWWDRTDDYLPWLKLHEGIHADMIDTGLESNSWVARPWMYPEHLHPTNWIMSQSIDFLRRRDPRKPFFLYASFVRPHAPLDPPQVYFDQYINEDIPHPPIGEWADKEDNERDGLNVNCSKGILKDRALKRARAAYYALITHIDHQLGRLLEVLKEYNELKNTVILFTSDHGEMMGDHNFFRKCLPYEGSSSIPFIIYDPGKILGKGRSRIIDRPVELRDVMPTLLDIAGIDIPDCVEGESIVKLIKGEETDWREYIHGEHSTGGNSNHFIANGREKYIWFSQTGKEQYFNLENDPQEMHDLSKQGEYSTKVSYWRSKLISELMGREEGYTDGEKLIAGIKPKACLSHINHTELLREMS